MIRDMGVLLFMGLLTTSLSPGAVAEPLLGFDGTHGEEQRARESRFDAGFLHGIRSQNAAGRARGDRATAVEAGRRADRGYRDRSAPVEPQDPEGHEDSSREVASVPCRLACSLPPL